MSEWLRGLMRRAGSPGEWSVATGVEDGQPVVVRTRSRAPRGMTTEAYPASVEIVWLYDEEGRGGMPASETTARMAAWEDTSGTLEGPGTGLLWMTVTGRGRREWIWFVADADAFVARVGELLARSRDRPPVEVRRSMPRE